MKREFAVKHSYLLLFLLPVIIYGSEVSKKPRIQCEHQDCSKSYIYMGQYLCHLYNDHDEVKKEVARYICQPCNYACFDRHRHKRVYHTKEKPYECRYCESKFGDYTTRKNHELIHTDEKPYACQLCDRTFRQPGQLKTHTNRQHSLLGTVKKNKNLHADHAQPDLAVLVQSAAYVSDPNSQLTSHH